MDAEFKFNSGAARVALTGFGLSGELLFQEIELLFCPGDVSLGLPRAKFPMTAKEEDKGCELRRLEFGDRQRHGDSRAAAASRIK